MEFNGLGMSMSNLSRVSKAASRSISPENVTGERAGGAKATDGTGAKAARDLGPGWKVSPSVRVEPGETFTLADIDGSGAIQQIWMTVTGHWRFGILRAYWDGQEQPSVESPVGDFFASGWGEYAQVTSLPVCVNPGSAFNSYWEMPFRSRARLTFTNIGEDPVTVYYQINYTLSDVRADCAYFHAQFRRVNPLPYKEVYTILDGVLGPGHYVGTYMAWGVNNNGWWGEGEIKFYLDGERQPSIVGTGTEDYFCGSYDFQAKKPDGGPEYRAFTTPYAGLPQVIHSDGRYRSQERFGMYRWHIVDPVRFRDQLRVTIQALGWRTDGRYLPLQDDIASVAYWYQELPTAPFPPLPDRDTLEVI